jgi:hypothetical protein
MAQRPHDRRIIASVRDPDRLMSNGAPSSITAPVQIASCDALGWVTPDVAFDHHGESSRSLDEDLGDRDLP